MFLIVALILFRHNAITLEIGFALFLVGAVLHLLSKGYLARNAKINVAGPYRVVRHPFYLANMLLDLGICVASGQLLMVAAYVPCFLAVYVPTMRREEQFLLSEFAAEYAAYAAKVPAFLPFRRWAAYGGGCFSWENVLRENEVPRILRILAIPWYFLALYFWPGRYPQPAASSIVTFAGICFVAFSLYAASMVFQWRRVRLPH